MIYIGLDRDSKRTYSQQIYQQLRQKILNRELKYGDSLPPSREMAKELNISRNTVITALDMLISEGYAYSIPGSGIYVCQNISIKPPAEPINNNYFTSTLSTERLSQDIISFDSGIPAIDLFPRGTWNRTVSNAFWNAPDNVLGYDDPQGRPELREVLSSYLKKSRGISCNPDQIIITSGAKQGLTLIAKCLLDQNSNVFIEDPSNKNVRQIFSYHTPHLSPIPVDKEGIRTDLLPEDKKPTLLFTTPSHQYPMGGILSIQRRLELIQFARKYGCYIVEDDYDSEFRYDGIPLNSLYELDNAHVIYVGTFSKVMFPSIRLGYLVLPYPLVDKFCECKRLADHHSNSIFQLALARFIESGDFERHIKRMKKHYLIRQKNILTMLEQKFSDKVTVFGAFSGMHLVASFSGVDFSEIQMNRLYQNGVYLVPVENHAIIKGLHTNEAILGYAHLDPKKIEQGLDILKRQLYS